MMSIYNLHRTLAVSEDREQARTRILSIAIKELVKKELVALQEGFKVTTPFEEP